MSESNEWLQNLKAGDSVIVKQSGSYRSESVKKVDRVTATQVAIGTTKYRRDNGREVGGSNRWGARWLYEATPEQVQRIRDESRRDNLAYKLRDMQWSQVPLATLEAIDALLTAQAAKAEQETATA
jgi:hypothetical protein